MRLKRSLIFTILLISSNSLFAQVTGLSGWDIYLDPGHSQKENVGIFGYSEAQKNLRVGLHLRELLLTNTDIDTVYNSRFNDQENVSLTQRTDEANSLGAAWFHSIHSDAGPPQLNSTLFLWGQLMNGMEKTPPGGQTMSAIMVDILTRGMRTNTRGSIGDCTFYGCTFTGPWLHVNRESDMPSELSEAGFHTNPVQNMRNMNEQWKRLEAYTFYWSILDFHGIERPPVSICTGFIFDVEAEHPVNGARVTLNGQEYITDTFESLFHNYSSDPDQLHNGFYFLEDLPNDTLEMIVKADGFYTDTSKVAIIDTFFTFKDVYLISSRPPFVTFTMPQQNDIDFAIWEEIVVEFSRRMNTTSVETTLAIDPEVELTISWEEINRRMRIQPDTLATATEYTLTISGNAVDLFNHPFDGNADGTGGDGFTLTFTTRPIDTNSPEIVSTYPTSNATGVENLPIINFVFDERLDTGSITQSSITLENSIDNVSVPGLIEHYVVNEKSILSFFPGEELQPKVEYLSRVLPGLQDQFGNAIESEQGFNFTTGSFSYSITNIDNFDSGVTNNWWAPQQSGSTGGIISEETSRTISADIKNHLSGSLLSMQLNYGWDTAAGSWLIREFLAGGAPRNVNFDDTYILQMYVFGDGSGNKIRFAVDDRVPVSATGNHEVSPWFTIDWVGWRLVSWDMTNDGVGTWIGDGRLDGTLRIDSIQLTYTPGSAETGTLYFDDLRAVKAVPVSVADRASDTVPDRFVLYQNYPNPFNPETTIRYIVAENTHRVNLVIYDVLGKVVRTLVDEAKSVGEHNIQWDGKDDLGRSVASGIYIYKLSVRGFVQTKKMVLVR